MKSTQDQSPTALPGDGLLPLESILCTEELNGRPKRPRDYETENRALASLAQALSESPRAILQTLADTILEVFQAGSAGLSLLTKEDGGKSFYWPAIAGLWKPHIGGGTPRDFGPCGDVLDRNAPLLFRHFERRYPYLLPVTPQAVECLLVPFYVEGKAIGTIWAITHDDRRTFDLEDLRQLVSLATFASSAYQVTESLVALDQQGEMFRQSEERYRIVAEATNNAVWDWNLKTDRVWWNEGALTLFGYRLENQEADSGWWLERIHSEDREAVEASFFDVVRGKELYWVDEYRFRCADGLYKDVYDRGSVLRDSEGRAVRMIGAMLDITARKQAEQALRESEQRWRSLTEALPQLVWSATPDGARDYFSTQWAEYTGVPVGNLLGWRWLETLHSDDREPTRKSWTDAVAGRTSYDVEYRARRADGEYRWFRARGVPIRDGAGTVCKWIGTCTEVTSNKELEEALRESEQRWRSLTEALPQLVWSATPDGACDYFSTQWTQHTGVPESELLGWRWLATLHPDDREPTRKLWTDALAGLGPYDVEYRVRRSDGTYRWFKTRGTPIRDSEGRIFKWFGTCTDISDDKRAEAMLRTNEERQRLIVDNAQDAFVAMCAEGRITEWNHQAEITFGWSRADAVGRSLADTIIPPAYREAHSNGLARFLVTGEGPLLKRVVEVPALRHDGSEFPAEISIAPVRLGEQYLFAAFIRDVTARKRADEELRRAMEAAEAANRAKDEFLANVSHEIRTPMNAILGMTELALDTFLAENQRQYLTTVKSAADALLGIINDILDFTKIEAGRLELDSADFSLSSVLGATLRALAVRAHEKGLELVCQQRRGIPDALIGDAGRLRQVLLNLVGNAIKFTERGEVVVLVELAAERAPEREVRLRFAVTDTGIGIQPEKQAKIFQAFEQEDTSTTRKYGGTGLGLTIAARLVTLMGGQISLDSAPGCGSTFAFTARFGLQPHPPDATAAPNPAVLRGVPVLIVDDNATNRQILEEWLRGYAMVPMVADDSVAAMAALWRGVTQGRPYPLALLDGRLPEVDGLALAAKIRQQAELSATRFILLTSGDHLGDHTRARHLGIGATLLKPLQQRELLEAILRVMGHQGEPEAESVRPAVVRHATPECLVDVPLRMLVAEDNEFNRDLLEHMLARLGLSAAMVVNGREALALLEREPFDLLLLDIHMPELDGFQVVGAIRERERKAGGYLPVIAVTARSQKEDRTRCLRAGMDDYLAKPFTAADLWAAIDRVLRTRPPRQLPRLDQLDAPVLLAACGGEPAMLRKMCSALQSRVPEYLATIREALHDQDAVRLREAAHKFYGMLSAFSTAAGDQAADLEDLAARGVLTATPVVVEQLDRLATELARVAGGVTVEMLRKQAEAADDTNSAVSPDTGRRTPFRE